MRVLAMFHAYPPHHCAGAELSAHTLLRHLAGEGHDVHVLLSRPSPRAPLTQIDGVLVHAHRGQGDPFRHFGTAYPRPNVVITHLENTPRASILGEMHGVPVVHLLHNGHDWTAHCLRRTPPALAVFNSEWMAEHYARWFAAHDLTLPHSIVVRPPVIGEDYATTPGKRITLINLNPDKGAHLFWELTERLPDRQFLGVRGAYGAQLNTSTRQLDNVEVVGHLPPERMREVYGQTRVLLMPSVYESWGRTAIEAAHCGIPTIAHPTPGLVEALGPAGIFADRDDPDAWVKELSRLFTPRGFAVASRKAKARAAELDPSTDLALFAKEVARVAR